MKVICIDSTVEKHEPITSSVLVEGETYNVVSSFSHALDNLIIICYVLAEDARMYGRSKVGYDSRKFIPLSEIDEMELSEVNQSPCTA